MKTHLDLFSGIGGFALAAGWAGYRTVGFCEVEDYPRRILSKRFSGVPIHGDIRELDGSAYRGVTLITGGYPCQPFSQAGKRKGAADDRHLWPEMLRVVKQARPAWVLAENVAGHITMGLDEVLADLEGEGYAARAVVVPACAVDAPHRRDRVWIVAKRLHDADTYDSRSAEQERQHEWPEDLSGCSEDELEPRSAMADTEQQGLQGHVEQQAEPSDAPVGCSTSATMAHSGSGRRQGGELQAGRNESGLCGTDVADTDSERRRMRHTVRQDAEDAGQSSRSTQHGQGQLVSRLGGAVDGLSSGLDMPRRWSDGSWEDGVPRVTVGAKNRTQRLKALGNAIVPQVAYELIRHLEVHG